MIKTQGAIELPREFDPGNQYWTLQAWVKRVGYSNHASLFQKGDDWLAGKQRFQVIIQKDASRLAVAREGANAETNVYIPGNQFIHLGIIYYATRFEVFVDGFLRESHNWTQGGAPVGKCMMGASQPDGSLEGYDGVMDEFWAASVKRSAMWMRMTFENQKTGSTLVTLRP